MDGFGDEQHTTDWSFDGVYTRYHNHSYTNGDRWSSTNTSEFPPINRSRLVKIVTFWLTMLLIGLICVIIYLAHIRETKTRYYISHGKLAILQEYTTALGNRDSMKHKSLTANFCNQMDKTFRKSRSYTNNYRMCVVTDLRPGSVIVTFTLYFDATVDVSDNAVLTAINDSVQQGDSKHMLGDYPIDINGLSVTTTLTLYEQDPLPFLEPNSDFIIPPTTKQTTTSTAVTSTSTIPATITTVIPPADTTETKQTRTSSTETTKVTTVMSQPTTETTKSTTTMPMTTTVETTTESHTKASTSTNTILLTSTTEPKTTTTLPSTVTNELTTTIPLTPTTEGTMTSHKSPTTTMTSTTLAPTVTTKSTNTIALPTTTQDTMTTTLVPTITTEATSSTTLPPSSTTKATTTIPFTSSTEAKTTTTMSLITTVATTSLSPTTTEAKTTTTLSPSTTTEQTTTTITPTVTSEVTTRTTGLPVVTTEETALTNTTREDITEATATNTTSEDTTREVTTEATTESTTTAAVANTTREDITTALVTNTTKEVTTEKTVTNTTSKYTTEVTLNTTREYTTEPAITNATREVTTDTTVVDTSEYTSGTSTIATTVSPFTANLNFPSKKVLAREDTTLECVIKVTDQWEKVTINQVTENDYIFLAEFYNNGSVLSHVTSEFLSVVFKQDNETIETIIHINIQNMSSCPSLLYFACGIIMEDTFKSVITKTSTLFITAPLHNVTLDMTNVYYSGERLELICRTITDFEYGEVALDIRSPNGSFLREPAPRTKYASTRNMDCSVEFEWRFKSNFSLDSSMNGSTVRCIASNRLLNTSVSSSKLLTVLESEVSFSQYYVSGSVGNQVTIECETNTLSSDIDKMAVYKTFNGTNETIALYSNGNTNSSSDVIVTFLDGVLTLRLSSLKCSDEGLYLCVVTSGSSEVSSPLFLTLQPTVLTGSTSVSLSLNIDIVEYNYRHTSEHSCFGEIGYPEANGYLSLTATHPTSGEIVVYNEEIVTDAMKVKASVDSSNIYNYGVPLADDFGILVREDRKVQENCSTIHKLRFFLNVSREWSRGSIRCEIRTKEERIPTSVKEERFYAIPSDACDNHNKTPTFYLDHERPDNCNTYIQCSSQQPPEGKTCLNPTTCMDVQLGYCVDCERATCREIRTTTDTPTTEAMQGNGYLDCNSSYVYEGESAKIGCKLNTTSFFSINLTSLNSTIASILADGSVIVYSEYQGKLTAILSLASLRLSITLSSVTCSDSDTYTAKMYLRSGNVPFTTFKVVMKVKPENPSLTLHHSLMDGQNLKSHSCTGYVGNPPGFLEIQIKRSSYSNFTKYSTPLQRISSSLVDAGNCSFRQTLNFSIDLTSDSWSNVTMRCVAINPVSLEATDVVPSSFLFSVTSITRDFCKNGTADYFDYHPMGCPFYVRCHKGTPSSNECPKDLCINPAEKACVYKY